MSTENKDEKSMPTETTKIKHTGLYYVAAIVCACILTTAILLVVLLPGRQNNSITYPPTIENPSDVPTITDKIKFNLPVANATLGQGYEFWQNVTLDKYELHKGIDFNAAAGTEVKAVASGTIIEASVDVSTGGKVVIDHGKGLRTVYMSIDIAENMKQGSKVEQGTIIGKISSDVDCMGDEKNLGSHLHFEVLQENKTTGKYENIDPKIYLVFDEK